MCPRTGPVDRLRERARAAWGDEEARALPRRYVRWGQVAIVPLPERLRDRFPDLGGWYADALRVRTVLRPRGPVTGEDRVPDLETIHGGPTETEVLEHGTRYRFDAARLLFSRGNTSERARLAREVRPGEQVIDLFAGIGYFALPIARSSPSVHVTAVERNPTAFRYLVENIHRNGLDGRVTAVLGDNREVELPHPVDRVVLGFLPSAVPWAGRAAGLLGPAGGTVHVHLVADAAGGIPEAEAAVRSAFGRHRAEVDGTRSRVVKAYGPGRVHVVVDARLRPTGGA